MQTNNLLATGGVMQEGGTKDPVSGNDVPAGALKEEVRDDIDAKLSPGEFVFPADVTRYIGLDKLMQIRDAAKEGLQEMESKGQMGNSEEVANDSVGEDKFSSHIDEIIAGLDGGEPKKFAAGGAVNTSDYSAAPLKGFKMVQYEDVETKAVKYIPFVNGKPLLPIPTGYTEKKATTTTTPTTPTTTGTTTGEIIPEPIRGNSGGRSTEKPETGTAVSPERDTGVEGFGDIAGGINPMAAKVAGFVAGLANPFVGLLVSAAGAYATKENNKKVAAANVKAMDASSLASMGFSATDIKAAQDAVATATLAGKSAKDIAVAAANAVAASNPSKTSLDGLIAVTKGWNTATPEQMKADAMPDSLKDQIPRGTWDTVVKGIKDGLTPQEAVDKAVASYGIESRKDYQSTFDTGVSAASVMSVENKIDKESQEFGGVPAGKYNDVVKDVKDGMSVKDAIAKANAEEGNLPTSFIEKGDQEASVSDRNMAARRESDSRAKLEKANAEAADRAAAQEASNRAAIDAANRAAEQQAAADRAEAAQRQADSEAKSERASQFQQSTGFTDGSYASSLTKAGADQGDGGG